MTVEQVWGRPAIVELRDRLATADGPHEMLTLLEEELMRRLCETPGLALVRHTISDVDLLESTGTDKATVARLAGRGSPLHKRHRVYIDIVTVAVVPDDYDTRRCFALELGCAESRTCCTCRIRP